VFQGLGYGLQADVAQRKIQTGRLNAQPLPCAGTNRQVRSSAPADLNLGEADALELSVLSGRSFGVQHKDGRARAWTEGRVARVRLGGAAGVEIRGVLGRANIRQNRAGRVFASSRGTTPGCIYFDGKCQGLPEDGQKIEIPGGVALLEVNKVSKGKRGLRVTALQITLFAGTPAESVVRLGNAHVRIRRV
ncbi:MAG TPA: choice-of-anchor P family protein, partial [Nocardioidaceae bacterium]|nr:choice-of-anchor P family protein [Nocardioidaceae bacterium]